MPTFFNIFVGILTFHVVRLYLIFDFFDSIKVANKDYLLFLNPFMFFYSSIGKVKIAKHLNQDNFLLD